MRRSGIALFCAMLGAGPGRQGHGGHSWPPCSSWWRSRDVAASWSWVCAITMLRAHRFDGTRLCTMLGVCPAGKEVGGTVGPPACHCRCTTPWHHCGGTLSRRWCWWWRGCADSMSRASAQRWGVAQQGEMVGGAEDPPARRPVARDRGCNCWSLVVRSTLVVACEW
jgi:hypothetical protein